LADGAVVVYFSELGGRLRTHQEVMLAADAKALARIKGFDFAGRYERAHTYPDRLFFVPDDTLRSWTRRAALAFTVRTSFMAAWFAIPL
jgi:hypothetical protein